MNLNLNEIKDRGLIHISNGFFSKLKYLHLMGNNISFKGIEYLIKAEFIYNLILLNLSENMKIGDKGIRPIKGHKDWSKLNTLNLNVTGLTDEALMYLGEASLPKLRNLYILGNKFTDNRKLSINGLKMNHINIFYISQAERDMIREKELGKQKEDLIKTENNKSKNQKRHNCLGNDYNLLTKFKNNNLNKFLNY